MPHRRPCSPLAALRHTAGHSQESLAAAIGVDRTTVARWETGLATPQAIHRRSLAHVLGIGLDQLAQVLSGHPATPSTPPGPAASIRQAGETDMNRRTFLSGLGAAALTTGPNTRIGAGHSDVQRIRDTTAAFSALDQRHGGGHARTAVVSYLTGDVADLLAGRFTSTDVRNSAYSAAGELAYLIGWMGFDASDHEAATHYFRLGTELAEEADDPPLAGHILRAMAHQALDRGELIQAMRLGTAAVHGRRYSSASPRERALLGVIHARTLIATGHGPAGATALRTAEDDLTRADGDEPARVSFFSEAALAHETGLALRDAGDLTGAKQQLRRSATLRDPVAFRRTHTVTLGYLAAIQARRGDIDEACTTWTTALDTMPSVRSGRAINNALAVRRELQPYITRGHQNAITLDQRTAAHLATAI